MKLLRKNKYIKNLIFKYSSKKWAQDKFEKIENFLETDDSILDLGAGKCALSLILKENNYDVTPVDVQNLSFSAVIEPIIYDGKNLPFKDNSFDTALLLTVLHHTPEPEAIIKEVMRVADKIIIIEDVYYNSFQKYLTYFTDSLFNFEFIGHPHSNKKENEWEILFENLNLKTISKRKDKVLKFYTQVRYVLEKND